MNIVQFSMKLSTLCLLVDATKVYFQRVISSCLITPWNATDTYHQLNTYFSARLIRH